MTIQIYDDNERFEVEVLGSHFRYRQLSQDEYDDCRTRAVKVQGKNGGQESAPVYDEEMFRSNVIALAYDGWRNVRKGAVEVAFTPDGLATLAGRAPSLKARLFFAVMEPWADGKVRALSEQQKN